MVSEQGIFAGLHQRMNDKEEFLKFAVKRGPNNANREVGAGGLFGEGNFGGIKFPGS